MDGEFIPCDQCGLRSWSSVLLPNGKLLTFCGHHLRTNRVALERQGAEIDDETHKIIPQRVPETEPA